MNSRAAGAQVPAWPRPPACEASEATDTAWQAPPRERAGPLRTQPHREPGCRPCGHRARLWTLGTWLGCLGHGTAARSQGTTCLHNENPSWGTRPRGHFKSLRAQEDPQEMCTHSTELGPGLPEPPTPGTPKPKMT